MTRHVRLSEFLVTVEGLAFWRHLLGRRCARVADVLAARERVVIEVAADAEVRPTLEPPEVELVRLSGAVSWVFDATAGTSGRR